MSDRIAPRGSAAPVDGTCQDRHTCSPATSYGVPAVKVNRPSPTRPPLVKADVALWPWWTNINVGALDFDAFDDNGVPLCPRYDRRGV